MEDSQAPALNDSATEDSSIAASPAAEPTTSGNDSPAETVEAPASEETPAPESEPERQQPRPAQRRIQSLVEENKQLKEQIGQFNPAPYAPPTAPKLSEMFKGQDQVMPEDLDRAAEQLTAQAANGLVDLKVQQLEQKLVQQQAVSNLEKDTALLPKEYPELDADSPNYNPRLEEAVAETWKRLAVQQNPYNPNLRQINPSVSLADVAKDLVELTRSAAESGKASASANLAAQADQSAMTPGTETAREKSFADMSLSEMEASLKAKGYDV